MGAEGFWQLCLALSHLSILLPYFQRYAGETHLDIGVGTGYYPAKLSAAPRVIDLLDLNPHSLKAATARIGEGRVKKRIQHDVLQPFPVCHDRYDSVSLFYLLHCCREK